MTVGELYDVIDDAWFEVYECNDETDDKLIYASWKDNVIDFASMPYNFKKRQVSSLYAYTITENNKATKENVEIGDIVFWINVY